MPLLLLVLCAGCGESGPPEGPGAAPEPRPDTGEPPMGEEPGTPYTLALTFTQEETPVQVLRRAYLPQEPGIPERDRLLAEALSLLVQGPRPEERARGISSFFGPDTAGLVEGVAFRGDTAVVDFGDLQAAVPNASTSTGSFHFLMELNGTVFAVPGIGAVEYRMRGSCEAFWNFLQRSCEVLSPPAPA